MRDGTTVTSTQYGIMYNSDLLVQLDATISGSNLLLRATPESGINGSTTYRIKKRGNLMITTSTDSNGRIIVSDDAVTNDTPQEFTVCVKN